MKQVNFFIFLNIVSNLLLIKISSLIMEKFGVVFSLLSIICYSLPSSIVKVTSRFIIQMSFKIVSLAFLFNIFIVILFENTNFPFLLLLANLIRGFISTLLINILLTIISLETKKGRNIKKLGSIISIIIFSIIFYFFLPKNFLSLFAIILNTMGFLNFFFLEQEAEPIYLDREEILNNKKIILKSVLGKFFLSFFLSLNKSMIIFLLSILKIVLIFILKYLSLFLIISYLIFSRLSKKSQATFLYLISIFIKTTNKDYRNSKIYNISYNLMMDISLNRKIIFDKYKKIAIENYKKSQGQIVEKQNNSNIVTFISTLV